MKLYILNSEGEPVLEPDLIKWAKWFEDRAYSRVISTQLIGAKVSTVFLGIDHSHELSGSKPVLWETMIFGGPMSHMQHRCSGNRDDAYAMHNKMVRKVLENDPS